MREIKFRAWFPEEHYSEPHMAYLDVNDDFGGNSATWQLRKLMYPESDGPVYMQYTGLKDRNGVEIYEGDCIKMSRELHIGGEIVAHMGEFNTDVFVEWVDGTFRLNKLGDKSKHYYGIIAFSENCDPKGLEVIGNIYEGAGV